MVQISEIVPLLITSVVDVSVTLNSSHSRSSISFFQPLQSYLLLSFQSLHQINGERERGRERTLFDGCISLAKKCELKYFKWMTKYSTWSKCSFSVWLKPWNICKHVKLQRMDSTSMPFLYEKMRQREQKKNSRQIAAEKMYSKSTHTRTNKHTRWEWIKRLFTYHYWCHFL